MILDTDLYYKNLSFLNCIVDQKQNHRQVLLPQLWLLLVFCLMVIIFPVLHLLEVWHFIPSLSKGNLSKDWTATMCSQQNEYKCRVYIEMVVLLYSGPPWKDDLDNVTMWRWLAMGERHSPSSCPIYQYIRRTLIINITVQMIAHEPSGLCMWSRNVWLLDTQVKQVGFVVFLFGKT